MNQSPLLQVKPDQGLPYIPQQAPFSAEQRAWLNGYLAGMLCRSVESPQAESSVSPENKPKEKLYILFGSQSGTAEGIAKSLGKTAPSKGFDASVFELNEYKKLDLSKPLKMLIVTSTWGDGDPPDNALQFCQDIESSEATGWDNACYAVLALGDSNYTEFCGAGKRIDERLSELGATRLTNRVDCDVDYEENLETWTSAVWDALDSVSNNQAVSEPAKEVSSPSSAGDQIEEGASNYTRKNPFLATFIRQVRLNGETSSKDTRHVEIDLTGSSLEYVTGDALGIYPTNCPDYVDQCLALCGIDSDTIVKTPANTQKSIREAMLNDFQCSRITQRIFKSLKQLEGMNCLMDEGELKEGMDLLDVVGKSSNLDAQSLVDCFPKLQPRLYSIASSSSVYPNSIHLTVGIVRYELNQRTHGGVCSTFLADRIQPGNKLPVFLHSSTFRLPEDKNQSIIMVGPGTGIAPFRGFLQERQFQGGAGKNWLFFGDQRESTDFLYRDELSSYQEKGILHRLDTAFSRDQKNKIYVQDRMNEQSNELWKWIDQGVHFYVCGDAKRMAKDVDLMLHKIIAREGGMSDEKAASYVAAMKTDKRYQRDVY